MKNSDKHPKCKLYSPQCSNHGFLSQASWDYLPRKQVKKALSLCDTPLMSKSKLQLKTAVTYKAHVNQTKNTSVLSSYFHIVRQKFEVTSPCRGSACWACQFLERFGSMLLRIFVSWSSQHKEQQWWWAKNTGCWHVWRALTDSSHYSI